MTIFAVPCDQPVMLTRKQAETILAESKAKRKSQDEREQLARDVEALFAKPGKK